MKEVQMKYQNILFVCAANICRSPMAEGLLKNMVKNTGFAPKSVSIRSAGIGNTHGSDASDQAIQVMHERGLDLSRHKARTINWDIVNGSDLILCMSKDQLTNLRQTYAEAQDKIYLLTEFCDSQGDIDDPSGRPTRAFESCASQMEDLFKVLVEKIK
jgi:protein-tyrosine-phosphatase